MKKLFWLLLVVPVMIFAGCSSEPPQAALSDPNPVVLTEHILYEDVLVEETLVENIITWDSENVTRWD